MKAVSFWSWFWKSFDYRGFRSWKNCIKFLKTSLTFLALACCVSLEVMSNWRKEFVECSPYTWQMHPVLRCWIFSRNEKLSAKTVIWMVVSFYMIFQFLCKILPAFFVLVAMYSLLKIDLFWIIHTRDFEKYKKFIHLRFWQCFLNQRNVNSHLFLGPFCCGLM